MYPFVICNHQLIQSKLKSLVKTGSSEDGYTDYYADSNTGENWLITQYESEYLDEVISVLQKLPGLAVGELVDIATTSMDINDIIGASRELLEKEQAGNKELRATLLERLLKINASILTDFEKQRLNIIIDETELCDATNRRPILGKHFTEIQKDASYYRTIAQKAKEILNSIG